MSSLNTGWEIKKSTLIFENGNFIQPSDLKYSTLCTKVSTGFS